MTSNGNLVRFSDTLALYSLSGFADDRVHAVITGRGGGVSMGESSSLNIAFNGSDNADNVIENRKRVFRQLSLHPKQVFFQQQTHEDNIAVITDAWERGSALDPSTFIPSVDAMITMQPEFALIARGADCQLICLYGLHPPAVAVIHAGWRSTVRGIASKTVSHFRKISGNSVNDIRAGFSPAAGPCCYEVGSDVSVAVAQSPWVSSNTLMRKKSSESPGKYNFDLWQANITQLEDSGISKEHIYHPRVCTLCHNREFYSYRKSGRHVGSHALIIWFKK